MTLVLIPGLLCNRRLYEAQIKRFGHDHPIYVPDHARFDNIEAAARHVLKVTSGDLTAVGVSMGGYVVMSMLRFAPERIKAVIFSNTKYRADTPEETAQRQALIRAAATGTFVGATKRLLPSMLHPDNVKRPDVAEAVLAMTAETDYEGFVRQQTAIINRVDSTDTLRSISCPTAVVVGDRDLISPPAVAEEMAALIKGSTLHIVPQTGHLTPLEQPEIFNGILAGLLHA